MKLRVTELLLSLIAVSVTSILATPLPISRSQRKLVMERQNAMGTCLQIAPELKPCNFDAEAKWRSTSGEVSPVGKAQDILPGEPANQEDGVSMLPGQKNSEEFELYKNDFDVTVVYYLEGCLPSRLPFDLPACPIEELQAIRMNKLVPFKLPDLEDALIFPEIDLKHIGSHRQSRESSSDKIQEFHKTMLNRIMKPRTGTASTKYVNTMAAAGPTPMAPGSGEKAEYGSVISDRDTFAEYNNKDKVQ